MTKTPVNTRRGHFLLGGDLAPGASVTGGAIARVIVPIAGLLRGRFRIETSSGTGTWKATFVRPDEDGKFAEDGTGLHTTGDPADVSVAAADTEYMHEIDFHGEAYVLLEYVDGGAGSTIKWATASLL